jgi:DNA end-binding protein Ku
VPRDDAIELRPFWSGTLSFGLVSVPVNLFPGQRRRRVALRMLAPDGTPLSRRFICPAHEEELEPDEIVRGYEVGPDEFVVVSDDELEALAPEKSRDIDLRVFVPREQVPPFQIDRSYFLTPDGDSTKAYRLLAETMERAGRAGIATFVMRGHEHLVAIVAENGILQAETLRFADELRSAEEVGLPEPVQPSKGDVARLRKEVRSLMEEELDESELADVDDARLRKAIDAADEVVTSDVEPEDDEDETEVVDLMEVLKRQLQGKDGGGAGRGNGRGAKRAKRPRPLATRTREELYERAKALDIPGRSRMSKEELIDALRARSR